MPGQQPSVLPEDNQTDGNKLIPNGVMESVDAPHLGHLLDRITLSTFVIDKNHVIRHWNSALEKLSGLSRKEMLGTRDQWRPFYMESRPCLADLMVDGKYEDFEHFYAGKYTGSSLIPDAYEAEDFFPDCGPNGEWLHFSASTIRNAAGEVIGAIETLTSISARKKAEFELLERERNYRHLSITDNLTGLFNSRYFYQRLDEALENARRYQTSFCLCFFDLDNFKRLNDTYGHLSGDRVLEAFGAMVRSALRATDSGYRYGGEEFVVMLPSTGLDDAKHVAERIRLSLENHVFPMAGGDRVQITVSMGLTAYQSGDTSERIIERVDKALYRAKNAGKNCLETG